MKATPPPLPASHWATEPLQPWLSRYVRNKRRLLITIGLSAAIGLLIVTGIFASLADIYFGMPPWARWIALAACACVFATLAIRSMHRAASLRRRQAMDEIESLLPAQGQLIRTALEESESTRPRSPTHELLAQALVHQAGAFAHRFHPERQLPWSTARKRWLAVMACAMVTLCTAALRPDFRTAVRRLIQPSAGITFTRLEFVDPPESIIAGDECRILVQTSGRSTGAPQLTVQKGEVREAPATMARDADDSRLYSLSLGKPGAAVTVRATAGDGTTGWLTIPVVYPPKLRDLSAELTYPEYTGLKPATQKSADIEAVEGTSVTITMTADRPLTSGRVVFSDNSTAAVDLSESTATFHASLKRGALTWKLEAADARGLALGGAGGKWIGLDDKPPKVEWVTPKDDIEATPLAEVTLRAKAKDDFGLLETGMVIQAGGRERVLHAESFDAAQGVPVTAVLESLAELERENTNIRDNVKVFAFARDRFPAPAGQERRGVSDLRAIDIRQFKVWRAMASGQGQGMPMPRGQQALMQLEELIKKQRGIVNDVFRLKEENVREEPACLAVATRQRPLSEATATVKSALENSEQPPPADDLALLDTAATQMLEAAAALEQTDLPPAWANADGALTSLLELRREFMKILGGQPSPGNPAQSKPDDFALPSLAALAKEAERLSEEERQIANATPQSKENSVEGDRLSSRQAVAQSDAGELFDSIVTHPEVTALAQSRMGEAESSMAEAARALRDRQPDAALPPLQGAEESLAHLAQHLRGLDAAQAANTLKQASDMARQSANDLKQPEAGKDGGSESPGQEASAGSSPEGQAGASPPGGNSPGSSPGSAPGQSPGSGVAGSGTPSGEAPPPGAAPGSSPEQRAAEQAATINDWLKQLSRQESLGRTAERLGALQRESNTEKLAEELAARAAEAEKNRDTAARGLPETDALAQQLALLADSLAAEHQRMVQGTLEKLAAAQAATRAMQAARSESRTPQSSDARRPGSGRSASERDGSPGDGNSPGEGQSPGESPGSAQPGSRLSGGPGQGRPNGAVQPNTGQGWGVTAPSDVSKAPPGSLRFAQDLTDLLREFQDTELTELSDALIRQLAENAYNRNIDAETLGTIEARLEALIQEVIQRQWLVGKSDRVPPEFEARVEAYFRRLSEDTGEEEDIDAPEALQPDDPSPLELRSSRPPAAILRDLPRIEIQPAPPPDGSDFNSPNLRLLPEQ